MTLGSHGDPMLLLDDSDDRFISMMKDKRCLEGLMHLGQVECSNIKGPARLKDKLYKWVQLRGMNEEEGRESGLPDKVREFIAIGGQSSIRRGPLETKKAKARKQG